MRGRGRAGGPPYRGGYHVASGRSGPITQPPMPMSMTGGPGPPMRGRGGMPRGRGRGMGPRGSGTQIRSMHPSQRSGFSSGYRTKSSAGACPGCDCSFNLKYSMSLQGLCKALQIICMLTIWAIIAASPYWRRYFIIGGVTWPFHLVMLLTIGTWLGVVFLYVLFLLGWHFSYRSINWPGVELWFNVCGLLAMIGAAVLQSVHVWRWDYRNGLPLQSQLPAHTMGGSRGSMFGGGIGNIGLSGGLGSSHFCGGIGAGGGGYGAGTQRDCMELLQAMAGINQYYGHHIFAAIFLWIVVIEFMVSLWLAWRTYQKFQQRYFSETQSFREPGMSIYDEEPTCGACGDLCKETQDAFSNRLGSFRNSTRKLLARPNRDDDVDTIKDFNRQYSDNDSGKGGSRSRSRSRDRVRAIHDRQRSQDGFQTRRMDPGPQQQQHHQRQQSQPERPASRPSMVV